MVDEIESGIRAEVAAHELTEPGLWTRLTVSLDRLTEFKTTQYSEEFRCEAAKSEPAGALASGLNRLVRGNGSTTINATIQVPVVDSARVDGEWVIPKDGVLIVGMGPRPGNSRRMTVTEELVVVGYRPADGEAPTPASPAATTAERAARLKGPAAN